MSEIATISDTKPSKSELPDIDSVANADVVIFDGQCNFCRSQVRRLNWFASGKLTFVSLHDPRVAERYPDLTKSQLMEQMYVVTVEGERFGGASSLRYLSRKLPRLWLVAPLLHIPFSLPVWQFLYNKIAKYRYLIAGKTDACEDGSCKIHYDK